MRTLVALALAGIAVVAPVGSAMAEPGFAPPEVPPGGVVFTDNPSIVNPHPMRVESWSRSPNANAVNVNFTSGTDQCYGVTAQAQETAETVTVDLQGGMLPGPSNRACIMIALFGTLEVPLAAPLGDRRVLSAA
ncbi:hypothetical protein DVS77_32040 [Mycolicibacterium moriokaense]|nr:hypothetical protein DVS77_32040 [Mycolicibacterium moriokaense]